MRRPDVGAAPDLSSVQRALLAEIRSLEETGSPGGAHGTTAAAWIAAPSLEAAREQIGVYREMYGLRLVREVAREFPATRALLGAARFDAVALEFVARTGSRSFTLEGYAASLPAFLRRTRGGSVGGFRLRAAAAALAAFELERSRVQRAPAAPKEERPGRLQAADGARITLFTHDVESAYARFARREPVRALRATPTQLAIFRRRDGRVAVLRVSVAEAPLLRSLLRGARIESAVTRASDAGMRPAGIRTSLARWVGVALLCPVPGS